MADNNTPEDLMGQLDASLSQDTDTANVAEEEPSPVPEQDKVTEEEPAPKEEPEEQQEAVEEEAPAAQPEEVSEPQPEPEPVPAPAPAPVATKTEPPAKTETETEAEAEGTPLLAPREEAAGTEQQGLPSFALERQKPLNCLTVKDILLWRNVYASGAVFAALQGLYVLLVVYEMTVLSLVSRLMLFNIVIALAYYVLRRIFTNAPAGQHTPTATDKYMIDADAVEPYVQQLLSAVNRAIRGYLAILRCEDLTKTLQFGAVVWGVSLLSQLMSGLTLFFLTVWVCFTAPRVYEWQKKPIDDALDMARREAVKYGQLVYSKIPKAAAAKQTKTE